MPNDACGTDKKETGMQGMILLNFGMKDRLFTDFAYFCEAEMKLQLSLCGG